MDRRVRDSLVWGLVGGLSFLVLIQGYELIVGPGVDAVVKVGVALLITAIAAVGVAALRSHLPTNERA